MATRKKVIPCIIFALFLSLIPVCVAEDGENEGDKESTNELGIIYSDTFKVEQCGSPDDPVKLRDVVVMPDPIVSPGKMVLTLTMEITEMLFAPIKLDIETQREIGDRWIIMPCIYQFFGSCKYEDLCQVFKTLPYCPKLMQKKVPCKCPMEPNTYNMHGLQLDIDPKQTFVVGKYQSKVQASDWMFGRLMCYIFKFEIVKPSQ